eukprot:1355490-Lingulodinium_polyedra.AAC.1
MFAGVGDQQPVGARGFLHAVVGDLAHGPGHGPLAWFPQFGTSANHHQVRRGVYSQVLMGGEVFVATSATQQ